MLAVKLQPVKAVIFDLDGVLSDTAALHATAWREVLDGVLACLAGDAPKTGRIAVDPRGTEGR